MAEYQTTIQLADAIERGSGMLELAVYSGTPSYLNVGAISGLEIAENMEVSKEENDNVDAEDFVTKHRVSIKANLHEGGRVAIGAILRGSFDTTTSVAASKVDDFEQVVASGAWAYNTRIEFTHQNADGTAPQIDATSTPTVAGSVDGPLVKNTDFMYDKDAATGRWGIIVIDSATVTTLVQSITITYDYTPATSKLTKTGNKSALPYFLARITTKNDGNAVVYTYFKCKITKGYELKYPKDDDADRRIKYPIEFEARQDITYNPDSDGNGYLYSKSQEGGLS